MKKNRIVITPESVSNGGLCDGDCRKELMLEKGNLVKAGGESYQITINNLSDIHSVAKLLAEKFHLAVFLSFFFAWVCLLL